MKVMLTDEGLQAIKKILSQQKGGGWGLYSYNDPSGMHSFSAVECSWFTGDTFDSTGQYLYDLVEVGNRYFWVVMHT